MADSAYKVLGTNDRVTTRTLLHEAIPLTGTIVSGTYSDNNIKNFSHGMFQSVYDYPYLSSSANHLFDITMGISADSSLYSSITVQQDKKRNIYNQMAQVLVGYDTTGSILRFDTDGNFSNTTNDKMDDVIFLVFSRLLVKDEIKKESFELKLNMGADHGSPYGANDQISVLDVSASNEYRVNSPAGEYGILYATGSTIPNNFIGDSNTTASNGTSAKYPHTASFNNLTYAKVGLIYYQAGVVVLTSSLFQDATDDAGIIDETTVDWVNSVTEIEDGITGFEISASADALRNRIENLQFNNTTELNSTIYFCRANHNEFNYSSNPTYLSGSKIRVKNESTDDPVSYITTVGLYNDRRELLAVAKVSEPLKKTPDTEFTLRVRLDY